MNKPDAVITLCKEFQREPTRRSLLAVRKAMDSLALRTGEQVELEQRMGFRNDLGELYPDLEPKARKPKAKKLDWSNVR
jgi:hypothetical protein